MPTMSVVSEVIDISVALAGCGDGCRAHHADKQTVLDQVPCALGRAVLSEQATEAYFHADGFGVDAPQLFRGHQDPLAV